MLVCQTRYIAASQTPQQREARIIQIELELRKLKRNFNLKIDAQHGAPKLKHMRELKRELAYVLLFLKVLLCMILLK